jgi:hypothetical protein
LTTNSNNSTEVTLRNVARNMVNQARRLQILRTMR